ncbi:hypothetical protein C8Q74DRAFT_1366766 [Fomes fomentarius]|nr:hypothetical protein C8Q74DRAFT_1366766 [Fomes fomentarius]
MDQAASTYYPAIDVPLNPQHRYCTPPPLDPALIDRPAAYDDFPQYTARPPSPDDFDELTGARPPLPPRPGSRGNPFVIEDAEPPQTTTTPRTRRRQTTAPARQPERRSARMLARTAPIPPAAPGSSRRHISVTSSLARPPAYSSRAPAAPKQRTPPRKSTGGGRSPRKTAANGFSPIKSSPLTQVLYRAPSEQSVASRPVAGPSGIQHASWDTQARKHSIEDVSMSDSSSDSGDDYY